MDQLVSSILDYSKIFRIKEMSAAEYIECKRRLLDVVACGVAAFNEDAVKISRNFATRYELSNRHSFPNLLGTSLCVSMEMAAFSNAIAIRYFDGADTFPGGGGHPSDCWAGLIAVAQEVDADVKTLFQSVLLAYDVFYALFKGGNLRDKGIDNAFYVTVATAVGAAFLLELDAISFANAVSLAIVPNVSLGVARTGALSMWKSGASANAARNGVFAALMAKEGLTGPAQPFSGERGLFFVTAPFDLSWESDPGKSKIFDAHMKSYLCDYHSQTAISVAAQLHNKIEVSEIDKVIVFTYWFAWHEVASDASKWTPQNRETADHSLPWIVAGVLLDGQFSDALFTQARFEDSQMLDLCARVQVIEDIELTRLFPMRMPCRIEITRKNGQKIEAFAELPHGHPDFPIDDERLKQKFMMLTAKSISRENALQLWTQLWSLQSGDSTRGLFSQCQVN